MKRFDLLCLGGAAVDWVLRVPRLPRSDEKLTAALAGRFPGGLVGNAACAAARLGLRVAWSGLLGDDEGGKLLLQSFYDFGVNVEAAEIGKERLSDFTVVLLEPDGCRTILVVNPGHALPPLSDRLVDFIVQARMVYTVPWSKEWLTELVHLCQHFDVPLALDVETTASKSLDGDLANLSGVAVLFCSQASLQTANKDPESMIVYWLEQGVGQVVVTQGSAGAWVYTIQNRWYHPAFSVPVVDTTGAGDCFHAAYLTALLEGKPPEESLRFASAAAALAVQHLGTREGLPSRDEVMGFLKSAEEM